MESNKLEWLRGPLPPISESILISGLVTQSNIPQTQKQNQLNSNSKNLNSQKNLQLASTTKPKKVPFKQTHVLSVKPQQNRSLSASLSNFQIPKPDAEPPKTREPIPFAEPQHKKASSKPAQENLTEQVFLTKQANPREFINGLKLELDATTASIIPVTTESLSPEEQAEIQNKLLDLNNYVFNKFVINEKTVSSEKALLLRRFMKFYNSTVDVYPPIIQSLEEKNAQYEKQIEELHEQIDNLHLEIKSKKDMISQSEAKLAEMTETLNKITEESNQKDITISSIEYDFELAKSQINNLKFRFNQIKEEKVTLQNTIDQRDTEIQGQLDQIDKLTKEVASFQNGEMGYIVSYHQEKEKNESLQKEIEKLEKKIYDLVNIAKIDVATDTSDLPVKKGKKKKNQQLVNELVKYVQDTKGLSSTTTTTTSSSTNPQTPDVNQSPRSIQLKEQSKKKGKGLLANSKITLSSAKLLLDDTNEMKETQTNPTELAPLEISTNPISYSIYLRTELMDSLSQSRIGLTPAQSTLTSQAVLPVRNIQIYKFPEGYNITDKLDELPELYKFVMPLFSDIYKQPQVIDLKILDQSKCETIVENEKPLIWGLQLIHNFLLDPCIRSIENKDSYSNEIIVVDWIAKQYKVEHLIKQVITDLTYIFKHHHYNDIIQLFIDMIEGNYNLSQFCLLSVAYSFSCNLTTPDLTEIYQNYDTTPQLESTKIHIQAIYKLYSLCFSVDIANIEINNIIDKYGITPENGMISYTSFLRDISAFFGEKHRLISNQARDLLFLVGCADPRVILYDVFESVMIILDCSPNDVKNDWKNLLDRLEDRNKNSIKLTDLLGICADRGTPLTNLLDLPNLKESVAKIKNLSSSVYVLYHELVTRFSRTLPHVFSLMTEKARESVQPDFEKLKKAILLVDVPKSVWHYKIILSEMDRVLMKQKGFIPFNYKANSEVINQLREYINKAEGVAFALLDS